MVGSPDFTITFIGSLGRYLKLEKVINKMLINNKLITNQN